MDQTPVNRYVTKRASKERKVEKLHEPPEKRASEKNRTITKQKKPLKSRTTNRAKENSYLNQMHGHRCPHGHQVGQRSRRSRQSNRQIRQPQEQRVRFEQTGCRVEDRGLAGAHQAHHEGFQRGQIQTVAAFFDQPADMIVSIYGSPVLLLAIMCTNHFPCSGNKQCNFPMQKNEHLNTIKTANETNPEKQKLRH